MSLVIVGAGVGALAAIVYCARKAMVPRKELSEIIEESGGKIQQVCSPAELNALFGLGGKAVVYLTASW